jgi:hypothetical protein
MVFLFLTAVVGRIAAEICGAKSYFTTGKTELPKRYQCPLYYRLCLFEALAAGGAAICLAGDSKLAAFAIGVGLPLITRQKNIASLQKVFRQFGGSPK